jgi:DNA-binding HxlR family transcriptional regulator
MSIKKKKFNCPAEMTVSLIGGKWKAILLYNLRKGPKRFGDLRRLSPGITAGTLTTQLRELEKAELVKRAEIGGNRLEGVEYRMTPKGESLKPVLYAMIRWGITHSKEYAIGDFGMAVFQK